MTSLSKNKKRQEELLRFLGDHPDTRYLEALTPDMNGILRGKRIEKTDFGKPFKNGVNFCGSASVMDSKGNTFENIPYGGVDGDPDMKAFAVPGTLAPVPWAAMPMGQVLLEIEDLDGTPSFMDPRTVLHNALKPLQDMDLHPVMATELEFYLVEHDGEEFKPRAPRIPGSELAQSGTQFGIAEDLDEVDDFLRDLDDYCQVQNIPAGAALSEFGPGQFEINLHHVDDPALACDHALLLKRAIKAAARKHELAASFMAKPFAGIAGCGLHVHISLLDGEGNNVFAGKCSDGDFSDVLRHAIGGLSAVMEESMAIFAPNANSYRRYARHAYVPCTPNWGVNHRDLSLRIPLSSARNMRVEHRVAGADANPYLVVATLLAGIHHGISNQCDPGVMVKTSEEIEYVATLPTDWARSLDAFDAGGILPDYLGRKYHRLFSTCRREEFDRFNAEISNRDFEWYLRAV